MGKRKMSTAEADHVEQLTSWTRYAKKSGVRLSHDAAAAARLHMSYGKYIAAIYAGQIKRDQK